MRIAAVFLLCALALGFASACERAVAAGCPCEVRVVLSDKARDVTLGGNLAWTADGTGEGASSQPVEVKLAESGALKATLAGAMLAAQHFSATPSSGYVRYAGRDYRGRVELFTGKGGGIVVLNVLPLEDYLLGVVPAEMPSKWPAEALRAQAVAARTYAVRRMAQQRADSYDVYAGTADQAYNGVGGESPAAASAVRATAGEILTYGGQPIVAYYCADAGGCTKCGREPYLQAVPIDAPDSPHNHWSIALSAAQLARLAARAGADVGEVQRARSTSDSSGHLEKLELTGTTGECELSGNKLRSLLGLEVMKSTRAWVEIPGADADGGAAQAGEVNQASAQVPRVKRGHKAMDAVDISLGDAPPTAPDVLTGFREGALAVALPALTLAEAISVVAEQQRLRGTVRVSPAARVTEGPVGAAGIIIHGSGYGHGLGLSQWGAKTLAERGLDYEQILAYFYRGVRLEDLAQTAGALAFSATARDRTAAQETDDATPVFYRPFMPGRKVN